MLLFFYLGQYKSSTLQFSHLFHGKICNLPPGVVIVNLGYLNNNKTNAKEKSIYDEKSFFSEIRPAKIGSGLDQATLNINRIKKYKKILFIFVCLK